MVKNLQRVPLDVSIHWGYLSYSEISYREIILKVFKSNHLQACEKEYWRLSGRFTKK